MRMRTVDMTASRLEREGEMRLSPHMPLLTLEECSKILGLTHEQVKYLHASALQKLGAALSAYGYHREFCEGRPHG